MSSAGKAVRGEANSERCVHSEGHGPAVVNANAFPTPPHPTHTHQLQLQKKPVWRR